MTSATGVLATPSDARPGDDRLNLLQTLDRRGVKFVFIGDVRAAATVVIAPFARNVARAMEVLSERGAGLGTPLGGDLRVATRTPDGRRYGELLLDTVPRELQPGLVVELGV